jgi:hypothetical protein
VRGLYQPDAQGSVRFGHHTLSLHVNLPERILPHKTKVKPACAEPVEFVPFLWKAKENAGGIPQLALCALQEFKS